MFIHSEGIHLFNDCKINIFSKKIFKRLPFFFCLQSSLSIQNMEFGFPTLIKTS